MNLSCPVRQICKQVNKMCSTGCPWWIDLRYQYELSGIPPRHTRYSIFNLGEDTTKLPVLMKWASNDIERVAAGQGIYLHGSVGTGKTTIACALANTYIIHKTLLDLRNGDRTKQLVQYANVPELLDLIKRGFDNPQTAAIASKTLENLRRVPIAILDDIGAERPSEWARERLLTVVGGRYDEELSTFFTSNLTVAELAEPLGSRLKSRIEGMTVSINYTGPDRRKRT